MQTSTENLSTLFFLGLSLVGSFEGFEAPPVASKSGRWAMAKDIVVEHGVKAPRNNAQDLTVLGYLAILEALSLAQKSGLQLYKTPCGGAFGPPSTMPTSRVTVAQRIALLDIFAGSQRQTMQTRAALCRKGLCVVRDMSRPGVGLYELALTDAGRAFVAQFQAAS